MTISSDLDRVRLLIGDTDSNDPLFQDDEITYFLELAGQVVLKAAANACDAAAAKFARGFRFKTDDQEFDPTTMTANYREMAVAFRSQATGATGIVPTKIDGYSQDIPADEVAASNPTTGRRDYYTAGDRVF